MSSGCESGVIFGDMVYMYLLGWVSERAKRGSGCGKTYLTRLRHTASMGLRRPKSLRWISGGTPRKGVVFENCFHASLVARSPATGSCMDTSFVLACITDRPMAFCGVVCGVRAIALEMLCEGCVMLNRSRTLRVHYSLYLSVREWLTNAKRIDNAIRYISDELQTEGTIVKRFLQGHSHLCMRCLPTRLLLSRHCLLWCWYEVNSRGIERRSSLPTIPWIKECFEMWNLTIVASSHNRQERRRQVLRWLVTPPDQSRSSDPCPLTHQQPLLCEPLILWGLGRICHRNSLKETQPRPLNKMYS